MHTLYNTVLPQWEYSQLRGTYYATFSLNFYKIRHFLPQWSWQWPVNMCKGSLTCYQSCTTYRLPTKILKKLKTKLEGRMYKIWYFVLNEVGSGQSKCVKALWRVIMVTQSTTYMYLPILKARLLTCSSFAHSYTCRCVRAGTGVVSPWSVDCLC